MSIITITSGKYTNAEKTVQKLASNLNYQVISDSDIIEKTARTYEMKSSILTKVVGSKNIAFNDFTHEKEKCIACLKKTVAEYVAKGRCIFHGLLGHLIPEQVSHVMDVLIITDKTTRIRNGVTNHGISEKEAASNINNADTTTALWINGLFNKKPWDADLYDIVIPSDKLNIEESVDLISEYVNKISDIGEATIQKEANDFLLSAEVGAALAETGSGLIVIADDGNIVITIDKSVMMLSKFKQKIVQLAQGVSGVHSVETKIGKNYYKTNIIRSHEFETPLSVLLVDDEKEFVQTLSERLKLRQVNTDVVYSGEAALDFTDREDTEVMVLDLKMPGIDGFEVLKKMKQSKPDIEVIILTGHGSEEDRKVCMELGAFAYLQKPADIDILTNTMKKAYEKINLKKNPV